MSDAQQARAIVAEATGQQVDAIGEGAAMADVAGWDSLAHMRIVLAVEERTGAPLGPDEIFSIGGVAGVAALLRGRGAA